MNHYTTGKFWQLYGVLPADVKEVADKNYQLLRLDPRHPSLHFKRIADLWSVRVGIQHRALGAQLDDGIIWFWIGTHDEYDKLIK